MKRGTLTWLAVVAFFAMCETVWAAPGDGPLHSFMEKTALKDGWTRSDKAEYYDKDSLFDLVNGEAEAYFPYGLSGAVSAAYLKNGDVAKEANVELYEMGSPLDAYGIYSSMREPDSPRVAVGTEGFGGSTQIMFYVGKYFVKARVYSEEAAGDLLSFAKAVAGELPASKNKPAELALVAIPDLVPNSDQYIGQSVLGYACWPKGMAARVKTKDAQARVFVVITNSSADAEAALDKYAREVAAAGAKIKHLDDEGKKVLVLNDPMQKGVAVSQAGKYLVGAANLDEPEKQGLPLVKQLRRQAAAAIK